MLKSAFWQGLEALVSTSRVVIDRPRGSTHPMWPGLVYPYDYGYLEGTASGDGHGVDVWLGTEQPRRLTGIVCTVDLGKRDVEIKLLLGCTEEERGVILGIHNGGSQSGVLFESEAG